MPLVCRAGRFGHCEMTGGERRDKSSCHPSRWDSASGRCNGDALWPCRPTLQLPASGRSPNRPHCSYRKETRSDGLAAWREEFLPRSIGASGITVASFVISGHGCDCPWCLSPGVTALNFWETQNWKADEARDRMSQPRRIQVMMGP